MRGHVFSLRCIKCAREWNYPDHIWDARKANIEEYKRGQQQEIK